jgi:hypothetical protein
MAAIVMGDLNPTLSSFANWFWLTWYPLSLGAFVACLPKLMMFVAVEVGKAFELEVEPQ